MALSQTEQQSKTMCMNFAGNTPYPSDPVNHKGLDQERTAAKRPLL